MSLPPYTTTQYPTPSFLESAGLVLFHLTTHQICTLHHLETNEHLLPKGRLNLHETRHSAALRETTEETGLPCRLLPVDMHTRAPPPSLETEQPDTVRFCQHICEPFTLQIRHLSNDNVKLIWWFVGAVEEGEDAEPGPGETDKYAVEFYSYADVLEKLTFQMDRDMVSQAIELVTNTYKE